MKAMTWFEKILDQIKTYIENRTRAKWLLVAFCPECIDTLTPVASWNRKTKVWELSIKCMCDNTSLFINWWFPDKREQAEATAQDFIKAGFAIEEYQ